MALDESNEDDTVFTDRDVTYVVEKGLLERIKPISIDYVETPRGSGFKLTSALDETPGCGPACSC